MLAGAVAGTAVLFAAAPTTAIARPACPAADVAPVARTLDQAARAVVCLVNAERARHGLRSLRGDRDLTEAAARHSLDMVRRNFFSHVTPTGADLSDRLRRSGYIPRKGSWHGGETLAWGTGTRATADAVVAEWIASPPHRRVLLGSGFREIGVGVAAGTPEPIPEGLTCATYTLDTGVTGND